MVRHLEHTVINGPRFFPPAIGLDLHLEPVILHINAALNDALKDDKLRAGYDRVGADIAPPNTPAEFREKEPSRV